MGGGGVIACKQGLVSTGDVLATLIRVEVFRVCSGPPRRIFKGVDDEARGVMVGNVPTHDLTGEYIDDGGQIPESIHEPEVGEVSGPDHVGSNGTDNLKDVFHLCFRPAEVIQFYEAESSTDLWLEIM